MKKQISIITVFAALPAFSTIVVDANDTWQSGNGNLGGTFDASGSDKLVFIVTGEHGFNQTANGTIGTVTYDGIKLTTAVTRSPIRAADGPPVVLSCLESPDLVLLAFATGSSFYPVY